MGSAVPISYEKSLKGRYLGGPAEFYLGDNRIKGLIKQDPKTQRLFVRGTAQKLFTLEKKVSKGDFPISIGQDIELPSRRANGEPTMRIYYVSN